MAPPSPRRSSRSRIGNPQSQHSSTSSGGSGRFERSMRSLNKVTSGKSTPTASLSSEAPEDLDDTLLGRRRKRALDDDVDRTLRLDNSDDLNGSDDLQEEEEDEAVRCICGSDDYPGRPEVDGPDAEFFQAVELTDDVIGFFVQCDICKVWQHGACVGIFSAESSPDEYFCEQCRPDLHKLHDANNGQKYSKYIPIHGQSTSNSRAASVLKDGTQSPTLTGAKLSRSEAASLAAKRRSTMNSRDAAYDDEQLRRAIEASRVDTDDPEGIIIRRPKRGRSDSEDPIIVKRQRTNSRSPSPQESTVPQSLEDSDDDLQTKTNMRASRNSRHVRDHTDREERERIRQEAALKRKGRAERRRGEDSDMMEEPHVDITPKGVAQAVTELESVADASAQSTSAPGTPPPTSASTSMPQKKVNKNHPKRTRGKPQSIKDQDAAIEGSPTRSTSRDISRPAINEPERTRLSKSPSHDQKHSSKIKAALASKMTLLDMRRRVAAIMEFISRTQVDLAAEAAGQISSSTSKSTSPSHPSTTPLDEASGYDGQIYTRDFKDLTCMEMMDILTRDMVKWQNQYS